MKKIVAHFNDTFSYDLTQKSAISVRDGIIEYYGAEIGMIPADKLFKVYRSPATIANAANAMLGIPVTIDHVNVDVPVTNGVGSVNTSYMIDLKSEELNSTVGILNTLDLASEHLGVLVTGKRELSLGYCGTLIEMPPEFDYDFEQRDIQPHHLAIVDAGRCGSVCSFIDHKQSKGIEKMPANNKPKPKSAKKFRDTGKELNKLFTDAEGLPSLSGIVDIVNALPDAIAALPLDEAQKVMPMLQEIVAKGSGASTGEDDLTDVTTEDDVTDEDEMTLTDDDKAKDEKKPFGDAKSFADAVAKETATAVKRHIEIVDHARLFLPENYNFKDKTSRQVMADAVATEYGRQQFADNELGVAFKMLKKQPSKYQNFGDHVVSKGKFSDHTK